MSFVSIIQTAKPVNKRFFIDAEGRLAKESAPQVYAGRASIEPVDTFEEMSDALQIVTESSDLCLVAGTWRGHESGVLSVMPEKKLKDTYGYPEGKTLAGAIQTKQGLVGARTKASIQPSNWLLIDLDEPKGFPLEWKQPVAERLRLLARATGLPFDRVSRIELRSSSNRVRLADEPQKQASHVWVRINEPSKIDLLRASVSTLTKANGLSFECPRKGGAISHLTICDLSVWSRERIVFCSRPNLEETAQQAGYVLDDGGVKVIQGDLDELDLSGVVLPDANTRTRAQKKTGHVGTLSPNGNEVVFGQLTLETPITVRDETKPLSDWIAEMKMESLEKMRCESPFRESSSEAAFVSIKQAPDGRELIRVFDSGVNTTYCLELKPSIWDMLNELRTMGAEAKRFAEIVAYDIERFPMGGDPRPMFEVWRQSWCFKKEPDKIYRIDNQGIITTYTARRTDWPSVFQGWPIDFDVIKEWVDGLHITDPEKKAKALASAKKAAKECVDTFMRQALDTNRKVIDLTIEVDWRMPPNSPPILKFAPNGNFNDLTIQRSMKTLKTNWGVSPEIEKKCVDDWLSHWPEFKDLLLFILAARVSSSKRQAYLWVHAPASSGKSFTFQKYGVFDRLGIVASITQDQMIKASQDVPSSINPGDLQNAWMIFVDEVTHISQCAKDMTETWQIAAKYQLAQRIPIYAKVMASADDVLRTSSMGIDPQISERVSVMRPSIRMTLKDRPVFRNPGDGLSSQTYLFALCQWAARWFNEALDDLRAMSLGDAQKWGDDELMRFNEAHSVGRDVGLYTESLPEVAAEFIDDCKALLSGRSLSKPVYDALNGSLRIGDVGDKGKRQTSIIVQATVATIRKWVKAKEHHVHARNIGDLLNELGFEKDARPWVHATSGYVSAGLKGHLFTGSSRVRALIVPVDLSELNQWTAA